MADEDEAIIEDGVIWMGTRESLEAWKTYKHKKAIRFVERGYSVAWFPDADNWMDIFLPERRHSHEPELRAAVSFFSEPSQFGINGGRISKLDIRETRTNIVRQVMGYKGKRINIVYNYDRGSDVDRLHKEGRARRLYDAILEELN